MTIWKVMWRGVFVAIGLSVLAVAFLLVYYRPTIEYAYVDITESPGGALRAWMQTAAGVGLMLLVVGALAWLRKKAKASG